MATANLSIRLSADLALPVANTGDDKYDIEGNDLEDESLTDPITAKELYTNARLAGLPMVYFAVGFIYGGQASILYPIYQLVLNEPQNYQNAIGAVVALFWSFKIFYGFMSDTIPFRGLRRKPYIVFGYAGSLFCTALQALFLAANEDTLYCFSSENNGDSYSLIALDTYNSSAVSAEAGYTQACPFDEIKYENSTTWSVKTISQDFDGNFFVALMFLTNFFYMFADVAADGMAVEYAKREPKAERGGIQAYNYCCRFATTLVSTIISMFALNTPLYGGNYTSGLDLSSFLWILFMGQAVGAPFWVIMDEKPVDKRKAGTFFEKLEGAWLLLQNRGFCTMMIFNVMYNLFTGINVVGSNGLARYWVGVSNLEYNLASVFQYVAVLATVYLNGRYLTNFNWRALQSVNVILTSVMGLLSLIIIYDVNRSPYFWMYTQVDTTITSMIGWLVTIWACNEMAPPGLEGTALAMATTSSNAATALATYFRNLIGGQFDLLSRGGKEAALGYEQPEAQDQYAYNLYIALSINMLGLLFLWLLPNQKDMAKRRAQTWGEDPRFGILGILIIAVAMLYGTITNLQTLFCPCSPSFGGSGCVPGTCDFAQDLISEEVKNATRFL